MQSSSKTCDVKFVYETKAGHTVFAVSARIIRIIQGPKLSPYVFEAKVYNLSHRLGCPISSFHLHIQMGGEVEDLERCSIRFGLLVDCEQWRSGLFRL